MAEGKYDYLKTTDILRDTVYPPFINMLFFELKDAEDFQIRFTHVSVPFDGKEDAHAHDFAQVFLFVPCAEDLKAYDAETDLYLGEEGDKVVINETTALYVPAGMVHCPIIHKRVGTPFFFVNCPITGKYSAIIGGETLDIPVDPRKK
jgi:hypothetical protein